MPSYLSNYTVPSSDDEDSVEACVLRVDEASNFGAVGLCLRAGFQ